LPHRSRTLARLAAGGAIAALSLGATAPDADVSTSISGLRSQDGQVLACLTANPRDFPDCRNDPFARKRVVPARLAATIDFGAVQPGTYAIALLHDENGNGKADMAVMIPREGFGFSRDAAVRFGPPSFASAAFSVGATPIRQAIRMRYIF
jgi:uncharacterized protein (DUF2141 family)